MGQITLSLLPSGAGAHEKYAMVITNDRALPDFRLTLKFETFIPRGYRVGSYLFDPSNEVGGELTPDQTYENQVGIYNDSDRPVEIKKVVTNNTKFEVKLDTIEGGKAFNLRIKSIEKLALGANKLFIKLLTDDPKQDTLEVTVIVNVAAAKSK
ncbi:MAG: hypothetical protein U0Y68_21715 [Blastocatellia bacterium]